MFNPLSAPLNIISFGIDVYKKYKEKKRRIKDAKEQQQLESLFKKFNLGDTNPNTDKLHDKTGSNNR